MKLNCTMRIAICFIVLNLLIMFFTANWNPTIYLYDGPYDGLHRIMYFIGGCLSLIAGCIWDHNSD